MRKNIMFKSMLRQPVRTTLLVILIGLATFAFFLRTAEFLTIRSHINQLSGQYRPIGVIYHDDYWGDVSKGVDLISSNPNVMLLDQRVNIEAVLTNMNTPDIGGMMRGIPADQQPRINEVIFTGTVDQLRITVHDAQYLGAVGSTLVIEITVRILEIHAGILELSTSRGNTMTFIHIVPYDGDTSIIKYLAMADAVHLFRGSYYVQFNNAGMVIPTEDDSNVFTLRTLYDGGPFIKTLSVPDLSELEYAIESAAILAETQDSQENHNYIDETEYDDSSDSEDEHVYATETSYAGFGMSDIFLSQWADELHDIDPLMNYYMWRYAVDTHVQISGWFSMFTRGSPVLPPHPLINLFSPEEFFEWALDFEIMPDENAPLPPQAQADVEMLHHHMRTVRLISTRDMSALPTFQRGSPFRLELLPQNVADASVDMPAMRQYLHMLNQGRFLTVDDHANANRVAVIDSRFGWINNISIGDMIEIAIPLEQKITGLTHYHRELIVRGMPETEYYMLEVEVVGTFFDNFTAAPHVFSTYTAAYIFVPESILPQDVTIAPPIANTIPGWNYDNHIPSIWFSFELSDSRYEQAFLLEYSPLLQEMGFRLILFESRPGDFWNVVQPMLLMVTFNAIIFWIVLLMVLALVVFLFLSQRRKDIAIKQALGFTPCRILVRLIVVLVLFCIPAILVGGYFGWQIAIDTTASTLEPALDLLPDFVLDIELTFIWFIIMLLAVLGVALLLLICGTAYMTRIPVLSQLQGVYRSAGLRRKKAAPVRLVDHDISDSPTILMPLQNRPKAARIFVARQGSADDAGDFEGA